jgi:hypothetical protein
MVEHDSSEEFLTQKATLTILVPGNQPLASLDDKNCNSDVFLNTKRPQ